MSGVLTSCRRAQKGQENADRTALHQGRPVSLRGDRVPPDHERDPQSRRLGRVQAPTNVEVPAFWSQVASDVLAQKYFRKAGVPARAEEGRGRNRPVLPVALGRRRGGARRRCPRTSASSASTPPSRCSTASPAPGPIGAGRAATSTPRTTRRRSSTSMRYMLAMQMVRAELAAVVQHRPALGLRHRRPEPGPLLRRLPDRQADQVEVVLRAPAAARLLHPVDRRRPRQRGRHHGPVGARGAPVQVRLRHRHQLLEAARRRTRSSRAAASRPA